MSAHNKAKPVAAALLGQIWLRQIRRCFGSLERNMSEPVNEEEAAYLEFDWFVGHVKSLSLDAKACCEDQGNYNVAHELWYFIRTDRLSSKIGQILSGEQLAAIDTLCKAVAVIPESARVWTNVVEQSEKNMTNEAWVVPRKLACIVLRFD